MFYFIFCSKFILGVIKRNPLFLHKIEWKNNGFFFTIPNMFFLLCIFKYCIIFFYYCEIKKDCIGRTFANILYKYEYERNIYIISV